MTEVSVVVPTRDRHAVLRRTLLTAHGQRDVDHEVVVVDDGSADGAATVAATDGLPRVRYVRNESPVGVSAARNRGIEAAAGTWIAFLDDDDLWAPDKLSLQIRAAEAARAPWVYTGDVNVAMNLRVLSGAPPLSPDAVAQSLHRFNPISSGGSSVVVRADVLADVGGFDPRLHRTEDWDLWIRLGAIGPPAWVPQPLVAYTFHRANTTAVVQAMIDEPRVLAARYSIHVDMSAMHRRAAWVALRAGRRWLATRHYAAAVATGDVRSIGRAAVALTYSGVGTDGLFRFLPRDAAWIRGAESWLADVARVHVDRSPPR
jgi:glycosyltransferase involved in cell wall biosynthesis